MKWKFNEFENTPELSSDIEWMLQSGQVSRIYFLEALTEAFYLAILRLTTTLLDDTDAAREATRKIFLKAILNVHQYRSQLGVHAWLFKISYTMILQIQWREKVWRWIENIFSIKGELTSPASSDPGSKQDEALWKAIDGLNDACRNVLILQHANGLSPDQISTITGLNLTKVTDLQDQAVLELSRSGFGADNNIEEILSPSLERRWPQAQLTTEEIRAYARSIEGNAGREHSLQRGMTTMKEIAIIGFAILLVFLMIWGGNRFFLRTDEGPAREGSSLSTGQKPREKYTPVSEKQLSAMVTTTPDRSGNNESFNQRPTATPTPTGVFYYVKQGDTLAGISSQVGVSPDELAIYNRIPDGATLTPGVALVIPGSLPEGRNLSATPVPIAVRLDSNIRPETSQDVLKLLNPEIFPFNTLWIDAIVVSPGSEDFLEVSSRFQVWLSERQFLMIGGPDGNQPAEVGIGMGGSIYVANPREGQPFFVDRTNIHDQPPMSIPLLFGLMMLFDFYNESAYSEFSVLGESVIAGRQVWVVNQSDKDDSQQALLWIDKETGLSLHVRRLDTPGFLKDVGEFRPIEVVVRSVAYDVDFPQELFNYSLPWRGGYAKDYSGLPISPGDSLTYASSDELVETMDKQAPPENFDLGLSRLSFVYPVESGALPHMTSTDVYAGDYYLGPIKMGVPWYASCQRSVDGEKIVFQIGSNGGADPTQRLGGFYYADLMLPDKIYRLQPAEPGANQDFAISPDSRTVAVWGCSGRDDSCGVYLHDMGTHKWRMLAPSEEGAADFTWSPDGKSLAWMNAGNVVIVMDVESGKISYTSDYDALNQAPPVGSPMKDWGVTFPPQKGGLEGCTFPPPG